MAKQKETKKTTVTETKDDILDSVFEKMSQNYNIPSNQIATVLRNTAFKTDEKEAEANSSEMISLLSVAEKYKLNPFTREIFAFRNKKGVLMPIVSVDGWIKIMNTHPQFDGFEFRYSEETIKVGKSKLGFEWIEIIIYVKDRKYPAVVREYLDECYVERKYSSPWDSHTRRMHRHKTLIQGVRVAFGVNEAVDLDEAERIDDALELEINREKEIDAPDTVSQINTDNETVPEAPKEKLQLGEIPPNDVLDGLHDESSAMSPEDTETQDAEIDKNEADLSPPSDVIENTQEDIFSNKEQELEPEEMEEIPDLF
jgi:phage recombination protein Bet